MIKINFHSVVNLITNSSTTIFTWQDDSLAVVKELVNEFFGVVGNNKVAFEDAFYAGVFADAYIYYEDANFFEDEDNEEKTSTRTEFNSVKEVEDLIEDILTGKTEKPEWMTKVEEYEGSSYYTPDRYLYIKAKDVKYEKLANLLKKFLNSPDQEASD